MAQTPCRVVLSSGLWCYTCQREQGGQHILFNKNGVYIFKMSLWQCDICLQPKEKICFYLFQVKTFMLKNPSSSVVSVEIRILSLYPAPLEALDILNKWYAVVSIRLILQTIIQLHLFCASAVWSIAQRCSSTSLWLICQTLLIGRFNISPLSVNISTTEFSLLASPLKVIPEN